MVDVVAALPPSDGQATAEVGDEHADEGVVYEDARDGSVAGVMCREHDLVLEETVSMADSERAEQGQWTNPEQAEKDGRGQIPAPAQGEEKESEEGEIPGHLLAVL